MISQRRLSRGLEKPVGGEAVKAASVIGKSVANDRKSPAQNNNVRAHVTRNSSLLGNSTKNNTNHIRNTPLRSPSMSGSGGIARTSSMMRNDPRQKNTGISRSYSLTIPKRGVTQQDAQSAFDDFGGPQHQGIIHKSPSISTMPKSTKTVKKYVPSSKGLIAIDVPVEELQQQQQMTQQQIQRNRSLTRSSSRNFSLLKSNSRSNSLTGSRSNSLTGPRSISLGSARTNSITRNSNRASSLVGSKANLQPPKRYGSLNSASLANGSRRNQPLSTPLEEEEEDTRHLAAKRQSDPRLAVGGNSAAATEANGAERTSKESLGTRAPSGRVKTVKLVKKKVPTAATPPTGEKATQSSSFSSPATLEDPNLLRNHGQSKEGQDVILEDEREEQYDDSGNRLWESKLENVMKQDLGEGSQQSSTSEFVSPSFTVQSSRSSSLQKTPVGKRPESPVPTQLEKPEEKRNFVTKVQEGGEVRGHAPQEQKDQGELKPRNDDKEHSTDGVEHQDRSGETRSKTAVEVSDKMTPIEKPHVNEPSQNRLRDYLHETDEHLEDSGIGSVASSQNPDDSLVKPLKISSRESLQEGTSTSANEDELAKEVRHELDIMGHSNSNNNSDENSDELFVDSREDVLDDAGANGNRTGRKVPSLPERNPKRGNGNKMQTFSGPSKVPSPIKSALKKTNSENSNPSVYTESSPANQAYLSLTTAENTRLNAQLSSNDKIQRKNPTKSINRSKTVLNKRSTNSLSPPPREAMVPKRHSHHIGIKTPVERKTVSTPTTRTRNSMMNTSSRNQQPPKKESANLEVNSKLNNPILYPREPPQKRSSFEKVRNKDNNIGMSKISLRDGAMLESNYQQSSLDNHFRGSNGTSSAPSSGTDSGTSSSLFSSAGFKSRFQDSDSEEEGMAINGANGVSDKFDQHPSAAGSNGNGFSFFKHKDSGEPEGFGKKFGKLSLKSSNGSDQSADYSTSSRFGGGRFESKTRTLRDEVSPDEELVDGGKKNVFGKKLKKLFGRNR
ncbi:hypothetical protein ZYGM_002291 [Zygosaccharomyces mellis]|uniref:Eisosome protein SEG1 n=1 Tax=Zygosaccharomyces mellis TaxID=42258 RepID=A0A4C2E5N8_9SACH|nr:hypothetical protein ZYGM_002291 [Zygosaccharomyces mellis]